MKKIYFLLAIGTIFQISAQQELVFVYFKDKPNKTTFYNLPTSELSTTSLERRERQGISLNDQDAPIEVQYINSIKQLGFTIEAQSKWLNGVAITIDQKDYSNISSLNFVSHIESFVKNSNSSLIKKISKFENNKYSKTSEFTYGQSLKQIEQINLKQLHNLGYTGKNVSIAILDTEFPTVDTGSAFLRVRNQNQIKGTYNFTTKQIDVYKNAKNSHGTNVFGILAGYVENEFVGSAPDANYYLYTTENANIEIPQEELYWIEAAEEADRVGVDIISTSLGYRDFDDSRYDYQYSDMNGENTFIARGAKIATEKGIIVVASAGNEGNSSTYKYILSPADQPNVFTIGSVDANGNISGFSSLGPNANQHPKPDASARGTSTYYTNNNSIYYGNGTSYSAPLVAGGIASLLQAKPTNSPQQLLQTLRETSSIYPSHNVQMGYGILNFYEVFKSLNTNEINFSTELKVYPNPIISSFEIQSNDNIINVEILDVLGKSIKIFNQQKEYQLSDLKPGVYFAKIQTSKGTLIEKLIKN